MSGLALLTGLTVLLLACSGQFEPRWLDLIASAHNPLLFGLLVVAVLAAVLLRRWWRLLPLSVVPAVSVVLLQPLPVAPPLPAGVTDRYVLLSFNARGDSQNAAEVLALIGEVDPDIICLQEASGDKTRLGDALRESYPFQLESRPGFRWFTTLLSRHPIQVIDQAPRRVMARYEEGSLQSAIVETPAGSILVGTCHLIRGQDHLTVWKAGNQAALHVSQHLAQTAGELDMPAILAGDLNGGPLSRRGRNVRAGGPWRLAQRPYPWHGTWPSHLPAPLRVQPDQVYLTDGLGVHSQRTGPSAGSDHRPIIVEFGFLR